MSPERFKTVIFICTGNYYRSRFSEYCFNAMAQKRGLRWRATSRGLQTWLTDGLGPISEYAVERLTAMGIPFDGERFPVQLSETDLESADWVVAVKEAEHRAMMEKQFPDWAHRIEYWRVDDLDCALPEEALPICQSCVEAFIERLVVADAQARTQPTAA